MRKIKRMDLRNWGLPVRSINMKKAPTPKNIELVTIIDPKT